MHGGSQELWKIVKFVNVAFSDAGHCYGADRKQLKANFPNLFIPRIPPFIFSFTGLFFQTSDISFSVLIRR